MQKALDYLSDYQLESACKDAPCGASSRVKMNSFGLGIDRYKPLLACPLSRGCYTSLTFGLEKNPKI